MIVETVRALILLGAGGCASLNPALKQSLR